jgi:hypothetical protein
MITVNDERIRELEFSHKKELYKISSAMIETFSTPNGRITLEAIMTTLKMFREASNEEERHLQNAGRRILYLMGAGTESDAVDAWLETAKKTALRRAGGKK